jgi:hypothetical protein
VVSLHSEIEMQRAYFKVGRDELVQMSRQGDEEAAAELIARGRDPQTGLKTSGLGARIGKAVKNPRARGIRMRQDFDRLVDYAERQGPDTYYMAQPENLRGKYGALPFIIRADDAFELESQVNQSALGKRVLDVEDRPADVLIQAVAPSKAEEMVNTGKARFVMGDRFFNRWPLKPTRKKRRATDYRTLSDGTVVYAIRNGAPRLGKKYIGKYDNLCPYSGKPMLGHEVCKPFFPKGPYGRADVLEQMSAEEIKAALSGIQEAAVQRGVEKRRGKAGQMLGGQQGMRLPLALPKSMSKRERTKYDAALLPRFQNVGPEPYDEVDILRLLSRGDRDGQMTTVRFFERMLERQLSDERSGRRTRHLNQIGFNKFDAPVAEAIYEEYQSSGMTPEINAMMAEMLVKYRGQLAAIASVGAQRTGRGIRTNPDQSRFRMGRGKLRRFTVVFEITKGTKTGQHIEKVVMARDPYDAEARARGMSLRLDPLYAEDDHGLRVDF